MDIILLRNIKAPTLIGVYDWERSAPQTLEIDLDIGIPSEAACHSDHINDTIHYGEVVESLRTSLKNQQFLLLEALAEHIASLIREEFGAPWVRVKLIKPGILPDVDQVGIMIERGHRP